MGIFDSLGLGAISDLINEIDGIKSDLLGDFTEIKDAVTSSASDIVSGATGLTNDVKESAKSEMGGLIGRGVGIEKGSSGDGGPSVE